MAIEAKTSIGAFWGKLGVSGVCAAEKTRAFVPWMDASVRVEISV